jgi:sugar phosphate isomerase/epimerase
MTGTNRHASPLRYSVSTWSLHRALGQPQPYGVGDDLPTATHGRGALSLLELPARIAAAGIHTLEICHFHLPTLERTYLAELRSALDEVGVELFSLLVDDGDITNAHNAARDLAWIAGWFEVASQLGAKRMRVVAGKSAPSAETLELSARGLRSLATQAQAHGIRLMTENWLTLLSGPAAVLALLDQLEGDVGLCLDFGNWTGPAKYAELQEIVGRAESCHAKANFAAPYAIDRADFVRCLDLTRAASFSGPYTLIYSGPGSDEWQGLACEQEVVQPYLA